MIWLHKSLTKMELKNIGYRTRFVAMATDNFKCNREKLLNVNLIKEHVFRQRSFKSIYNINLKIYTV